MDIRRLEAFRKVYELGSFSKAGQELFLSQPTISAHVLSLEQELSTQLFDRLGRTILPTQAGEILYRHSLEVFAALENAKAEISLLQKKIAGEILVGGSTIPATYILPKFLAEFTRRYPDVRVRLTVGDSQEVITKVSSGELSLGVVGSSNNDPDLLFTPLIEDTLLIAVSPNLPGIMEHFSDGAVRLHPDELRNWPWVLRELGSGTRKAFDQALANLGIDIRGLDASIEARTQESVVQCAYYGLGLCVTSRFAVQSFIDRGDLLTVVVEGMSMQRSFYIAQNAKRYVFPAMRYFLDFLSK